MKKKFASVFLFCGIIIVSLALIYQYYLPYQPVTQATIILPTAPQYIVNYTQNQVTYIKANSANTVLIKWNPPILYQNATMTGFNIYRGTSSGYETYLGTASPSQFAFVDQTLQTGQKYWYYVVAVFSDNSKGLIAPEISIQN